MDINSSAAAGSQLQRHSGSSPCGKLSVAAAVDSVTGRTERRDAGQAVGYKWAGLERWPGPEIADQHPILPPRSAVLGDCGLASELAHEFGLGDHVSAHGGFHIRLGGAGGQPERGIQRINLEEVAVGLAGGRAGAPVADAAKVVAALAAAAA